MDENMMMLGHFRQISFISGGAEWKIMRFLTAKNVKTR